VTNNENKKGLKVWQSQFDYMSIFPVQGLRSFPCYFFSGVVFMLHKDIRYRKHQRTRHINRRLYIIKHSWGENEKEFPWAFERPGRFDKWNLVCSCEMCKSNIHTSGWKKSDQRKLLREKDGEEYE